jgi:hypothetical protein
MVRHEQKSNNILSRVFFGFFFCSLLGKQKRNSEGRDAESLLIIHQNTLKMCGMLQLWNHSSCEKSRAYRAMSVEVERRNRIMEMWTERHMKNLSAKMSSSVVIKIHFRLHISHDVASIFLLHFLLHIFFSVCLKQNTLVILYTTSMK